MQGIKRSDFERSRQREYQRRYYAAHPEAMAKRLKLIRTLMQKRYARLRQDPAWVEKERARTLAYYHRKKLTTKRI